MDPTQKVTLTLVNLGDTVEPVTENGQTVYYIGEEDMETHEYSLNEVVDVNRLYTGTDPDNPVTAWVYAAVRDAGDGRMIVEPESSTITGTVTMTGDITLYAFHNTEAHYVRVVVLEDDQATNLIEQGQQGNPAYDETPDGDPYYTHYYLPVDFGGTVDFTYPVSLTEYQELYDGAYGE